MNRNFKLSFTIILMWLGACSSSPKTITLEPQHTIQPVHLVNNVKLYLEVNDVRTIRSLGTGVSSTGEDYDLQTTDKLSVIVSKFLITSFEQRGFIIVDNKTESEAQIYVDIVELFYREMNNKNPATGRIGGTLFANASNHTGKFSEIYEEDSVVYLARKQGDEAWVNDALEATLNTLAYSKSLIAFLDTKTRS